MTPIAGEAPVLYEDLVAGLIHGSAIMRRIERAEGSDVAEVSAARWTLVDSPRVRIAANIDVDGFALTSDEMAAIDALGS